MDNPSSLGKRTQPLPVIVNADLTQEDVAKLLRQNPQLKVRVTDSTVTNSIIFPKSSVAFLYVPLDTVSTADRTCLNQQLLARTQKMRQVHCQFYVLLVASLHAEGQAAVLDHLQQQYFGCGVNVIPCHNASEAVKVMTDISKMTGRTEPLAMLLRARIESVLCILPDPSLLLQQQ